MIIGKDVPQELFELFKNNIKNKKYKCNSISNGPFIVQHGNFT